MEIQTIEERAALLGADVRCVGTMLPSDAPQGGITGQCAVLLQRDGAAMTLMRPDFRSEGMSPKRARITDDKAGATRLDVFLATIAALQARERAVEGHGTREVVYPPWAFSVDALALEIASADGLDLWPCSRPAKQSRTFTMQFGRLATAEEAWQWSRTTHGVQSHSGDAQLGSGRSIESEMKGSRLSFRVLSPKGREMTLREEPTGTWLLLWGTRLPDTVLVGLKDRRLSDVVEGVGERHRIIRAETRDGVPWLKVSGPKVPLAPAPEGVTTEWLEF